MSKRMITACMAAGLLAGCGETVQPVDEKSRAAGAEESCVAGSWVAGTTEWCRGRLIYRDYVYDDYGADSGVPASSPYAGGTLAATAGDARYPAGAENTADLVRLELSTQGDEVVVEIELNTLYAADQAVAAIAVDADDNATTGGGDWPGLGVRSAGWDVIHRFGRGDAATNLITGAFPRPDAPRWRIWAVVAQADGTVMNVAFRGPDEKAELLGAVGLVPSDAGAWWEDRQAAVLRDGDITVFAATVDAEDFDRRTTRAAAVGPGLHQRVYTSRYVLAPGEGVSLQGVPSRVNPTNTVGSQQFNFLGRYQPYGYYLPEGPGPHALQLKLHGLGATHASLVSSPGFQRDLGDAMNRVLVAPLGRGVVGFWSDISERDAIDVLDDALEHLDVDRERVTISGYSMGGYGALRLAMLYPDRFAALINWVGPVGDDTNTPLPGNPTAVDVLGQAGAGSFVGNMVDFAGNLHNLPSVHLYAGADTTVHLGHSLTLRERLLAATGGEHEFFLHPAAEHFTLALVDEWLKEAAYTAERRRDRKPARITYRTDSRLQYPEYGVVHDRAYWIDQIVPRSAGIADVAAASAGCGDAEASYESGNDVGVGPAALAWERQYRRARPKDPVPAKNRLDLSLRNVSSLRIDLPAACLHAGGLRYRVETEGPVTVHLGARELSFDQGGVHEGTL